MKRSITTEEFWQRVDASGGPESCWPWLRSGTPKGYGKLSFHRRRVYAHRLAYELAVGAIQEGLFVCHRCDNPPCCNPAHLFLGTAQENIRDRDRKGRHRYTVRRGERANNVKLSAQQVQQIRGLYATGLHSYADLGRMFGVTKNCIGSVIRVESWREVAP